jgi:hypothetical protein
MQALLIKFFAFLALLFICGFGALWCVVLISGVLPEGYYNQKKRWRGFLAFRPFTREISAREDRVTGITGLVFISIIFIAGIASILLT